MLFEFERVEMAFTFKFVFGTAVFEKGQVTDDVLEGDTQRADIEETRFTHQLPYFGLQFAVGNEDGIVGLSRRVARHLTVTWR